MESEEQNLQIWRKMNAIKSNRYYYANKDKLLEKIDCPCGGRYDYLHKAKHLKTKKHNEWLCTQPE